MERSFLYLNKCWILIPELGIRRIQVDELEKLKGITDHEYTNLSHNTILQNVEQHVWASLFKAVSHHIIPTTPSSPCQCTIPSVTCPVEQETVNFNEWTWHAPDLTPGRAFYNKRVRSLHLAVKSLGEDH